jgi:hypothetical protein
VRGCGAGRVTLMCACMFSLACICCRPT